MKTPLPPSSGRIALFVTLVAGLLALPLLGQRATEPARAFRFHDWSTRHVVFAHVGAFPAIQAAQNDPRALFRWREVQQGWMRDVEEFQHHREPHRPPVHHGIHRDWSISLGTAGTAPAMYPAKFSFDVNAVPSCANDFIVFPVNVAGSATQPNLVAFNNLYSGTAGGNGICNRAPSGTDNGIAATVFWSYNIHAVGGAVTISPVLSFDGTGSKVAFIESAAGAAHFHVLAWKSGDGKDAANAQNVLKPVTISSFSATAPAAGSGAATDLALGTASDTLSSPFIDYATDRAYVGNDQGTVFRVKDVFCTINPACAGGSPPAPSLDATWGTGGAVTVGPGSCAGTGSSRLTGPILDSVTSNVFVGCADGRVYGFNSSGAALATPSLTVGNGSATGGVVDPPIVDGVNAFIYAVSGSNGANAVLVQAKTDLTSPRTATLGAAGVHNIHAPTFNDAYFSSATSTNWLIYAGGYDAGGTNLELYASSFTAARLLNTGAPVHGAVIGNPADEFAPLTEFKNGATDWLFLSVFANPGPNLGSMHINAWPGATFQQTVTEGTGTSGMTVDNVSASIQASSIYFSTATGNAAVKLTQNGLR